MPLSRHLRRVPKLSRDLARLLAGKVTVESHEKLAVPARSASGAFFPLRAERPEIGRPTQPEPEVQPHRKAQRDAADGIELIPVDNPQLHRSLAFLDLHDHGAALQTQTPQPAVGGL